MPSLPCSSCNKVFASEMTLERHRKQDCVKRLTIEFNAIRERLARAEDLLGTALFRLARLENLPTETTGAYCPASDVLILDGEDLVHLLNAPMKALVTLVEFVYVRTLKCVRKGIQEDDIETFDGIRWVVSPRAEIVSEIVTQFVEYMDELYQAIDDKESFANMESFLGRVENKEEYLVTTMNASVSRLFSL